MSNKTKKEKKKAMVLSLWKELFYGVIHLLEYAAYTEIHTKSDGKTNKEIKTFMSGEKSNCAQSRHFHLGFENNIEAFGKLKEKAKERTTQQQ